MTTDAWLAISAGATLLLALATVGIIWQNYLLQKRERREKLLNEIIEWAVDIVRCALEQHFQISTDELNIKRTRELLILHTKYQVVDIKSHYIQGIGKIFGKDFLDTVIKSDNILDEHLVLLRKVIEGQIDETEVIKQWDYLVKSAIDVINKAAEMKVSV